MKKRDWVVAAVILAAAFLFWAVNHMTRKEAAYLRISVDNEIYGIYDLSIDQEISIQDTNICRIEAGKVTMTEADCPDQICVHTAPISADGGTIVCLPNRIVLEITNGETG